MKKTAPKLQKPGKNDPLRAYRFSGALRHILSALYGIVLGYALMSGNPVVNYFAIALSVIFLYVVLKTLLGKLLVKSQLSDAAGRRGRRRGQRHAAVFLPEAFFKAACGAAGVVPALRAVLPAAGGRAADVRGRRGQHRKKAAEEGAA